MFDDTVDLGTVGGSQTNFTDATAQPNTTYSYRVVANDVGGSSSPGSPTLVLTLPNGPTGLSVTSASSSEVDLQWNALPGVDSYTVERSDDQGSSWAPCPGASNGGPGTSSETLNIYLRNIRRVGLNAGAAHYTQNFFNRGLAPGRILARCRVVN